MSDTQIFGKTFSATLKACCLYVGADICMSLGNELQTMTAEQWAAMSLTQVVGWTLTKLGSVFILIKAFYSNSNKPQNL